MECNRRNVVILRFTVCVLAVFSLARSCTAETRNFYWEIAPATYTRNCFTKPLLAVNGLYPGPQIDINEGDRVVVTVKNTGDRNVTIHWHGILQLRSCWQDGVAYITECPIIPGNVETYDFVVTQQRGTTFWHAHDAWVRATVYGAFVTRPLDGYPFDMPYQEITILLGEWWNIDVQTVEDQALAAGGSFALADALTMNGLPGSGNNCSAFEGMTTYNVTYGETYLFRVINAALNTDMFFAIADHPLTVVEADSMYVKPFTVTEGIVVSPGQTTNFLVTANQRPASYYMVGQSHSTLIVTDEAGIPQGALAFVKADVPPMPTTGLFQYSGAPVLEASCTFYPTLPAVNDTVYTANFEDSLKTLHPEYVPYSDTVRHMLFTVGTGSFPCPTCDPTNFGYRVAGMVNNISFVNPTTAILPAYFYGIPGVYSPTFPDFPPVAYDYTNPDSPPTPEQLVEKATRVSVIEYGTVIELVIQDVNNFAFESHPFHLHGAFFYVLGRGLGNYDPSSDPATFNNYDPPSRYTVNVPARGWVAIRWLADNPGTWLFHCHIEKHLSWGMEVVFIVKDGSQPDQTLPPPPGPLNPC